MEPQVPLQSSDEPSAKPCLTGAESNQYSKIQFLSAEFQCCTPIYVQTLKLVHPHIYIQQNFENTAMTRAWLQRLNPDAVEVAMFLFSFYLSNSMEMSPS
jgi:hypothetical protein